MDGTHINSPLIKTVTRSGIGLDFCVLYCFLRFVLRYPRLDKIGSMFKIGSIANIFCSQLRKGITDMQC